MQICLPCFEEPFNLLLQIFQPVKIIYNDGIPFYLMVFMKDVIKFCFYPKSFVYIFGKGSFHVYLHSHSLCKKQFYTKTCHHSVPGKKTICYGKLHCLFGIFFITFNIYAVNIFYCKCSNKFLFFKF